MLTPSYVMRDELCAIAKTKHELYRKSTERTIPPWEELDSLVQDLNIVATDHLSVKVRILLGDSAPEVPSDELNKETLLRASGVFRAAGEETLDHLRRIEHERCLRFYYLNNWHYAPKGDDSSRLHSLMKPFNLLDAEDQRRHDQAWGLLEELAKMRTT